MSKKISPLDRNREKLMLCGPVPFSRLNLGSFFLIPSKTLPLSLHFTFKGQSMVSSEQIMKEKPSDSGFSCVFWFQWNEFRCKIHTLLLILNTA